MTKINYFLLFELIIANLLKYVLILIGPAGIKIGQVLSHHSDIFSEKICNILSSLTNNVPGLSKKDEKIMLENAKKFINYEKKPIKLGAGCIAVTYMTSVNNENIVIKIKRPNIEKKIETSFYIIYNLLTIFSNLGFINLNDKLYKIKDSLIKQADFEFELCEIEYFYNKYSNSEIFKNIKIPKPYRVFSNKNLICLEYLKGKSFDDIDSEIEKTNMAEILWNFAFHSSFIDGHWHSDLHKGNLICLGDKLGIIDFGITGCLKGFEKSVVLNYNSHILKQEWKMAARLYVRKMTNKTNISSTNSELFISDIAIILEKYFGKCCPNMIGSVSAIDKCSRKYGTRFNNRYAKFEIAFSTMAGTMVELGYNNIYTYMQKKMIYK
tara:strand:- start:11508 stop:12650 length:1143 start_codon:yes stop_codon:yes gene_type:complete